ncbi:MAG: hypothetical protein FWD58_10745 [Firmicutes bacterium]|nr:hypothetical protein [Bacillota bacterium]
MKNDGGVSMSLKQPISLKKQLWLLLILLFCFLACCVVCAVNVIRIEKVEIEKKRKPLKKIKENKQVFLTLTAIIGLSLLAVFVLLFVVRGFTSINLWEALALVLAAIAAYWIPIVIQYSGLNIGWNGFEDK